MVRANSSVRLPAPHKHAITRAAGCLLELLAMMIEGEVVKFTAAHEECVPWV